MAVILVVEDEEQIRVLVESVRLNNSWVTMTKFIRLSASRNGYLSKETD
jgi:hypothetical protein